MLGPLAEYTGPSRAVKKGFWRAGGVSPLFEPSIAD